MTFDPCFNPRPRTGGDRTHSLRSSSLLRFQSTPPHRGRLAFHITLKAKQCFNPRPRTGGDYGPIAGGINHWKFQSTPPHRGRRLTGQQSASCTRFQSTPPHRGRLEAIAEQRSAKMVSIHAPAQGATRRFLAAASPLMFQSTPPHRGRRGPHSTPRRLQECFNPRPRTGGDAWRKRIVTAEDVFQSTPPHRGRPYEPYLLIQQHEIG